MIYSLDRHFSDHDMMGVRSGGGGGTPSNQYSSQILLSDTTQGAITELASRETRIREAVRRLYDVVPDAVLTTTGAGDLQSAITSLSDGQVLEIQASCDYSPITIPAGKSFGVRVKEGYFPRMYQEARCIRVDDGASNVIISGLIIEEPTNAGGNNNYTGSAITYSADECKVSHIIFHNITIRGVASGSGIVLSHHWTPYYEWTELADCSTDVAFVGCHIHAGCADGTEGACILLRGFIDGFVLDCRIDNAGQQGRGVLIQAGTNMLIKNNRIRNMNPASGNAEGIKIDFTTGTPTYYNTAHVIGNTVEKCLEGIDIDDVVGASVIDNVCRDCGAEGISLDNDSTMTAIGNVTYLCGSGIRLENGSSGALYSNISFFNTTNYRLDNGYSLPASNSQDLKDWQLPFKAGLFDSYRPATRGLQGALQKPDFDFTNLGLLFPSGDPGEIAYIMDGLPHGYRIGSNIRPHVHFIQSTAATPVFKLDYRWYDNGTAPPAFTTITASTFVYAYSSGSILQIADFPEINGSGITGVSSMLDFKFYRDDVNIAGDVLVKAFGVHYVGDTFGSAFAHVK